MKLEINQSIANKSKAIDHQKLIDEKILDFANQCINSGMKKHTPIQTKINIAWELIEIANSEKINIEILEECEDKDTCKGVGCNNAFLDYL